MLVLAVFTQSRDSSVDLVFQGVALAYGDTHAITKVLDVGECRARECVAFASRGLQETVFQQGGVCNGAVETTRFHVQVDFVLRAVRNDNGTFRRQNFLGETVVNRAALYADFLAFEFIKAVADHSTFLHHQARWRQVVLVGEINGLLAVFGDGHRGQDCVDFAHFKCRDQAIEFLLDPHALDLHLLAQCITDVVVKTHDTAIRGFGSERRVSRFNTNFQRFVSSKSLQGQHGQCQGAKKHEFLHLRTPSVKAIKAE